jgi:glucose/arabinose dehydrogenase
MALDPDFPTKPYVYVLYTYDHVLGSSTPAPRWGTPGVYSDPCPTPPGPTADGCVVSGRLTKLTANGNRMAGAEQVLVEEWCQQYPSHSTGSLEFGPDRALYATGGDGASFTFVDRGQAGAPVNPCGDPPGEGGALRSQDLRTNGDPVDLNGALIRIDPTTGAGRADNPLAGQADADARRILAYGMRNPFRFAIRPGANDVWIGDVGWNRSEEINRIPDPTDAAVENFGWPCYEGGVRQGGYDAADIGLCENLYAESGAVTAPYFAYQHESPVVPGETCATATSALSGVEFSASTDNYPSEYAGALFFSDYARDCIWVMPKGADGRPAPSQIRTFVAGAANPVNIESGPGGDLYYVDFDGGAIRRIRYFAANQPPVAVAAANPRTGPAPLTVTFSSAGSTDPDAGDRLSFAWDLDGDGAYDDSTAANPTRTFTTNGVYAPGLKVTDSFGASSTTSVVVAVGDMYPKVTIAAPTGSTLWKVGDVVHFSGGATDAQDGPLPASALTWDLVLNHCPSGVCHQHPVQSFVRTASGSFVAPDHEYPSSLELRLTATDSDGLASTVSVRLEPRTVGLTFRASAGLRIGFNSVMKPTPFTQTVIVGSKNSISAVSPQASAGRLFLFSSWSDGGARTREIVAPATATTYTATYRTSTMRLRWSGVPGLPRPVRIVRGTR